MGKYIKAVFLLLLAAAPIALVLILIFGEDSQYNADYTVAEYNEQSEIEYGYADVTADEIVEPQYTTLTLGGLWFSRAVRSEVERFNSESERYRIELLSFSEYTYLDPITGVYVVDYEAVKEKDVDMIIDDLGVWFSPVDLYAFIDADPELNREDFFPNVLASMESSYGTLSFITYAFGIETMISMREVAEQISPFTFQNIFMQLNEPSTPGFVNFGLPWNFIVDRALLLCGDYFLDLENNLANFYNDEFLSVLKIAEHPIGRDFALEGMLTILSAEWGRFQRGDALLSQFWINNLERLRIYDAILGGIVATGIPTVAGGVHVINTQSAIGITADSPHQEVAWSFIRRFLLPTHGYGDDLNGLPLRIDLFEESITRLMTADIRDGVEYPRELEWPGSRTPLFPEPILLLYAMTEYEAAQIREIVETAVSARRFYDVEWHVHEIVREEAVVFIETARTAEETALVIQERVQALLDYW